MSGENNADLRFNNRVVIITGAGGGLGRAYALLFGSRGAKVVVNDLGGSRSGSGNSSKAADVVVEEVKKLGGEAIANYDSVENGDRIVAQALKAFGRVDIIINNAGILRDKSFAKMSDEDWDLVLNIHLRGAYKTTKAAWEIFRKQKYGRIIMTASGSGLYGNYGQANYSSAKLALAAFSNTLAKEGEKYNIHSNAIAPIAASRMTKTTMPPEIFDAMKPEHVAPFVALLCHESCEETGGIFELGAGQFFKVRWERAEGALFKPDPSFLPGSVLKKFDKITNFSNPQYPTSMAETDWIGLVEQAKNTKSNPQGENLTFKDKIAIVTGAGGGLGRSYALLLARLGSTVIVNDLGYAQDTKTRAADVVVQEIKKAGGNAIANYDSCVEGDKIVDQVLKKYGRIDILINNAGILRDKSFVKITDQDWDLVYQVHLKGTFKLCKAAWPHMIKQKYGRIINTSSAVGLYGNFGQANYSAAKAGILGLSQTLAIEGEKHNIKVNIVVPNAGTRMTATIMPPEMVEVLKPDYIAPLVGLLAHEKCPETGASYEVGSCWIAKVRWQRTQGYGFPVSNKNITPEQIAKNWDKIIGFEENPTNPTSVEESVQIMYEGFMNSSEQEENSSSSKRPGSIEHTYSERDVILYALGIGASKKDLDMVYENSEGFKAVPTYGVVLGFSAINEIDIGEYLPNYNPAMLLHGEQYLEIKSPLPTSGTVVIEPKVVDLVEKGKNAIIIIGSTIKDKSTGSVICNNESSLFIRNAGGFGGNKTRSLKEGPQVAQNNPPNRKPDATTREKIDENLAVLYRLSGDYNPLHIDPQFSQIGGFKTPILHGLCTYGISAKHVINAFGKKDMENFVNIKARFSKHVIPGETIETQMWIDEKNPKKIIFQVRVVERDCYAVTNAAVELRDPAKQTGKSQL